MIYNLINRIRYDFSSERTFRVCFTDGAVSLSLFLREEHHRNFHTLNCNKIKIQWDVFVRKLIVIDQVIIFFVSKLTVGWNETYVDGIVFTLRGSVGEFL
jgi:hypothetical protein